MEIFIVLLVDYKISNMLELGKVWVIFNREIVFIFFGEVFNNFYFFVLFDFI